MVLTKESRKVRTHSRVGVRMLPHQTSNSSKDTVPSPSLSSRRRAATSSSGVRSRPRYRRQRAPSSFASIVPFLFKSNWSNTWCEDGNPLATFAELCSCFCSVDIYTAGTKLITTVLLYDLLPEGNGQAKFWRNRLKQSLSDMYSQAKFFYHTPLEDVFLCSSMIVALPTSCLLILRDSPRND